MSDRLDELKRKIGETRRGLEEAVRRLGALRERLRPREQAAPHEGERANGGGDTAAPLFPGMSTESGGIDDVELRFEALGTEVGADDSKREER
jgi:hypothetical protein